MRVLWLALIIAVTTPIALGLPSSAQSSAGITVRLGASVAKEAVDGRLLLLFAKDTSSEPRFQISATSLSVRRRSLASTSMA